MPYQRSTQAQGFKKRSVFDESSKLRQYAKDLDAKRKEEVRDYERVAQQMSQEATRVDSLESKKDTYELNNLKQFSKTLNNTLKVAAETLGQEYIDAKVQEGITEGVKAAQGDEEALSKIAFSERQLDEIEEQIAEQREKSRLTVDGIEQKWDEAGYRASLEEKYRLLNIKKLGANRAYGFRKGLLTQAAVGWDAFRDSSLLYNPNNELSTRNIGTEEDPIVIGRYRSYDNRDKKNAILTYLQREYIKNNGYGLNKGLVDRHLTRPMLERTAVFQQKEYEQELKDDYAESLETLKENVSIAMEGIDIESQLNAEGGLKEGGALHTSIQEWLLSGAGIYNGLGVNGSGQAASLDALVEHLVGKGSELRSGSKANIDDQEDLLTWLQAAKFDVPGITKKGTPQTLVALWSDKFNISTLRKDMMLEASDREAKKTQALRNSALVELRGAVNDFHDNGDPVAFQIAINGIKDNDQYSGIITKNDIDKFTSMATELKMQTPEQALRTLKNLEKRYQGIIPLDAPELQRIPQSVLKKWKDDGKIQDDPFEGDETLRNLTGTLSGKIVSEAKKILNKNSEEKVTDKDPQLIRLTQQLPARLLSKAKLLVKQGSHIDGYTLESGLRDAHEQLMAQLEDESDPLYKGTDYDGYFKMDANGFISDELNPKYANRVSEDANKKDTRLKILVNNIENQIDNSGKADYFGDKDAPPLVTNDLDYKIDEDTGEIAGIWHNLQEIDTYRRPGEVLYNLEAAKRGLPMIDWSQYPEIDKRIKKWNSLNKNTRGKLLSKDRSIANNAMNESGAISMDWVTNTIIPENNDYFITSGELPALLSAAGLPSMTYTEFQSDENVQRKVFKTKTYSLIKQIEQVTSNKDEGLRRLFAGLKYGDHNTYNDNKDGINKAAWTMKALNAYYSGDTSVLEKHDKGFSLVPKPSEDLMFNKENFVGSETNIYGQELALDVDGLSLQLIALEEVVPEKYLRVDSSKLGFFEGQPLGIPEADHWTSKALQTVLTPTILARGVRSLAGREYEYVVNPEYKQYLKRKTTINDHINILKGLGRSIEPQSTYDVSAVLIDASIRRVIGEERYKEIKQEAREKGLNTKRFNALLYEEPEIVSIVNASNLDKEGNLNTIPTDPFVGEIVTGELQPSQLTTVKGFGGGYTKDGGEITIRNDVAPSLIEMLRAAREAGHSLNLNSGYRNLKEQEKLYKKALRNKETDKDGNLLAKKPGESNHNLGTAVDLNYTVEGYQWLLDNAERFGFFPYQEGLNPDDPEAWHWDFRGTN